METAASFLLLITLSWLLYHSRGKILSLPIPRREMMFVILPLVAFILWSGLSMIWAPSWQSALYHTMIWAEYLVFYLLFRGILDSADSYKLFTTALSILFVIISVPAIIEYISYIYLGGGASTIGIRYAKYGEFFLVMLPLLTAGVLSTHKKQFLFGVLLISIIWLFIISTLSRGNLILFVFGMLCITGSVFFFKRFQKYRRKMLWIILGLIISPILIHSVLLFTDKPAVPVIGRISDEASVGSSNTFRKLGAGISLQMFAIHWVTGIGADNFGAQFNDYRKLYAAQNPADINLTAAESELAERTHNEYLQILAELGIVGGLIFTWFISGVGLMLLSALKRFRPLSLFPLSALLGLILFLVSSLVSSFSFRLVQNGLVFFFVLAVAAKFFAASKFAPAGDKKVMFSSSQLRLGYSAGIIAALLLTANCLVRAASAYYSLRAQQEPDIKAALPLYEISFQLDKDNADNHYACGLNLFNAGRYSEAASQLQLAIEKGAVTSMQYSYLASAQMLAGDGEGAEKTFADAVNLYPFSSFVHARYASILKANDKTEESAAELNRAMEINANAAQTWWVLMEQGARAANQQAFQNKGRAQIMDLTPANAVDAVIADREARFPAEKSEKIPLRPDN